MQSTIIFARIDLREKLNQLLKSGLANGEVTSIRNRELKANNSYPFCYVYKGYGIEITPFNPSYNLGVELNNPLWESNIHCGDGTIITVGAYKTQLEAALKAEKSINQW